MARALELAEKYRGRTAPNPIVGCVIVNARGEVIAEGAHKGPGTRHGEIDALAKLGNKARGATLYVNLEPCTHHGRTPPCLPVVRDSGVARVVIGTEDPVPGHGGGIEALRRAGISVSRVLVDECDAANLPFLTWGVHRRPAFTLKAAITLDGKIATVKGHSKWITGDAARADVHHLRDTHDAVLVGAGTVLADDPWLTARRLWSLILFPRQYIRFTCTIANDRPPVKRRLPASLPDQPIALCRILHHIAPFLNLSSNSIGPLILPCLLRLQPRLS